MGEVLQGIGFILSPLIALMEWIVISIAGRVFNSFLSKAKDWGQIEVVTREGKNSTTAHYGDLTSAKKAQIVINNRNRFLWKCIAQADIGFSEAFMEGDIEVDDLTTLFKIFTANRDSMNGLDTRFAWLGHIFDRLSYLKDANTVSGSRKNIHKHYDLGNEMFSLFLDPTMTYSSAFWNDPKESLEQAQTNKLRKMIEKVELKPGDHLLEIGSGWGSLAIEAVKATGCRVTTVTLSTEQKALAEEKIKALGYQDRIEVVLIDYRDLKGQYDKIISIEMLEAVGHEFMPTYFECCYKLLKPGGKMAFQVITTPNKNYETYRRGCDFIQKYIFPGSLCPSINAVVDAVEKRTKFVVERTENIGYHYARTLREWRVNFIANKQKLLDLGFDEVFIRKWIYYFCYCEAGFDTEYLGDYQVVLTTPKYLME